MSRTLVSSATQGARTITATRPKMSSENDLGGSTDARIAEELKLSDTQKEKVREAWRSQFEAMRDLRNASPEERREKLIDRHLKEVHLKAESDQARAYADQYRRDHPVRRPAVRDVAAHVDHVVKLVGVDHVGFGSDFEGVGDSLPEGLKDVGDYPNLVAELLALGYTRDDLRKICGGNLLRVWRDVERVARTSGGK